MSGEHIDVLIVGAGLSGVGAAHHLQENHPGRSYVILEARESIGGTWDLFRYPGVRSDSDMFTLGYRFRPWTEAKAIADGPSILSYVRDTASEAGIDSHIRFGRRVISADWSSERTLWTVRAERTDTGETVELTADFVILCTGYYRYEDGYTPSFPGVERFAGQIVHPQHWSDDIDYDGKRVAVIGSGATAVTLVPALAERAAHVTMLQRSPSYVISLPGEDPIANALRRLLPAKLAYAIVRWKNVAVQTLIFQLSRHVPVMMKAMLRKQAESNLPAGYDIDTHFTPTYNPWDQRMCLIPDADLFEAIGGGGASVLTDQIDTFTETGIRLRSGREIEADLIVTATGLDLLALGGTQLSVDGVAVDISKTVSYKGLMLCGVPNLAFTFGYTNASWTLKADLTSEYVCRLLSYMDEHGYRECSPLGPGPEARTEPFLDLSSGYVQRAMDRFPRQGARGPWRNYQNYARDILSIRYGSLEDDAMRFRSAAPHESAQPARESVAA